jgi:chromosome partitioning protein
VFDLNAVKETIACCRELRRPYAVVINGAPPKRNGDEAPIVAEARAALARLRVPLWPGQITHRTSFALALAAGEGAREFDVESHASAEIGALWSAIDRSVKAIRGLSDGTRVMHRTAA